MSSHEKTADYLADMEASGIEVFVVPGNHDINNEHYSGQAEMYPDYVVENWEEVSESLSASNMDENPHSTIGGR